MGVDRKRIAAVRSSVSLNLAIAVLIAFACGAGSYARSSLINPVILSSFGYTNDRSIGPITEDIWFDADVPKNFRIMTDRRSAGHLAAAEHPLIALAFYLPTSALQLVGLTAIAAVRVYVAIISG